MLNVLKDVGKSIRYVMCKPIKINKIFSLKFSL